MKNYPNSTDIKSEIITSVELDSLADSIKMWVQSKNTAQLNNLCDEEYLLYRIMGKCNKIEKKYIRQAKEYVTLPMKKAFSSLMRYHQLNQSLEVVTENNSKNGKSFLILPTILNKQITFLKFEVIKFEDTYHLVDMLDFKTGFYISDLLANYFENNFMGTTERIKAFKVMTTDHLKAIRLLKRGKLYEAEEKFDEIDKQYDTNYHILEKRIAILDLFPQDQQIRTLSTFIELYEEQIESISYFKIWLRKLKGEELDAQLVFDFLNQVGKSEMGLLFLEQELSTSM